MLGSADCRGLKTPLPGNTGKTENSAKASLASVAAAALKEAAALIADAESLPHSTEVQVCLLLDTLVSAIFDAEGALLVRS